MQKKSILILVTILVYLSTPFTLHSQDEPPEYFQNHVRNMETLVDSVFICLSRNENDNYTRILNELKSQMRDFANYYIAGTTDLKKHQQMAIKELQDKIRLNEIQIKNITDENSALKTKTSQELINLLNDFISTRDEKEKEVSDLKDKLRLLDEQDRKKDIILAAQTEQIGSITRENGSLIENNKVLNQKLNTYNSAVSLGLSIGFNYYFNNQLTYTVQSDSLPREKGSRGGASGIISAIVSVKLSEKGNLVINIPLGDFTSNRDKAIGIFNQRVAVGLGYSYRLSEISPNLAIAGIFNVSPYQKIDYDEIRTKKLKLPEFTRLNPDDFGATTEISPSITIGIVYSFVGSSNSGR